MGGGWHDKITKCKQHMGTRQSAGRDSAVGPTIINGDDEWRRRCPMPLCTINLRRADTMPFHRQRCRGQAARVCNSTRSTEFLVRARCDRWMERATISARVQVHCLLSWRPKDQRVRGALRVRGARSRARCKRSAPLRTGGRKLVRNARGRECGLVWCCCVTVELKMQCSRAQSDAWREAPAQEGMRLGMRG